MTATGLVISSFSGVTVVSFQNRSILDGPVVDAIGAELFALVDQQAQRKIVLDFSEVHSLTSSMLGVLVSMHKKAEAIKGSVVISGMNDKLMEVFKVTSLQKLLQFAADEAEAFRMLGRL